MANSIAEQPPRGVADPDDVLRRARSAIGAELTDLRALPGGASSITYSAELPDGGRAVVKVAPPGLAPVRNRDVLRQAHVLTALADVGAVAVPGVLGSDRGAPPEVPPLFVMGFAVGESYEPRHSSDPGPGPAVARARGAAAATMLAALHAPEPTALGISDGPTDLGSEIDRWTRALRSCPLTPDTQELEKVCRARLTAWTPAAGRSAVLHGDHRLGNMLCHGAEITAVIDWEIWSVGDPRLDLAWMRLMHEPAHPTAVAPEAPSLEPAEVLAAYEAAAGPVTDIAWFDALVRYKQAAISALLVKNADERGERSTKIDRFRRGVGMLLGAAHDHLR